MFNHLRATARIMSVVVAAAFPVGQARAQTDIIGAEVQSAAQPKTPAVKTITSFSQSLRCMDEMFLAFGKQGIVITSAGIPDETGKVRTGTKEMLITAISKMTVKSGAFEFIDLHSQGDDLGMLFQLTGGAPTKVPDYYIRGSITQMDDNTVRKNKGGGISLPFLDLSVAKDDSYDLLSMDMSIGEAASRRILPDTSNSNSMVIVKGGRSGEAGGKLGKAGLSFNIDLSRSEGLGAATRTLVELGLIETLGRFTKVPYWKCLDIESSNPMMMEQAREWYETAKDNERILFVQRKLQGMSRYRGPLDGKMSDELKTVIAEYQAQVGLVADGRMNFSVYFSLLDDTQNALAALPMPQQKKAVPSSAAPMPAPVAAAPAPVAPVPGNFQIRLDSDKGPRPTYRVGDFLYVTLTLNSPGTAYCYYEDVGHNTARIFPNQFSGDPLLKAGSPVRLPGGGFKIRFDKPGRERVACVAADREMLVPAALKGTKDLTRLPVRSVDEVVNQFKQMNPGIQSGFVDITVQ